MIKPMHDNVVLKVEKKANQTSSGIILGNESEKEVYRVVALGKGKYVDGKLIPLELKLNDQVIFKKYAEVVVEHDNEKYIVVGYDDILAIIE